jgi:hypothetical protein
MESIIIEFIPNNLGRVTFLAEVMTGDFKSFKDIEFKLDSGSDFTTINSDELLDIGYTRNFLEKCPFHSGSASTADESNLFPLQYISNVSIKFGSRELQCCRVFFALDSKLKTLFGSDVLKYFNRDVNYDTGTLRLKERINKPQLSEGETPLQVYSLEKSV